jgi:hypothetical protein
VKTVFDSGAILACERDDPRFTALVAAARAERTAIIVPATVVAETWRRQRTHPRVSRFVKAVEDVPVLDLDTARVTGALLARAGATSVVDGNVVQTAIALRPSTIVTSDPDDICALLSSAGVSHAPLGARRTNVDVVVFAI